MAKKSAGRLAGLAALGAAAYMMRDKFGKGKDATGPAATADEERSSKARTDAQKEAVSGNRATDESSYTGTTKNNSNAAKNIGFGGGDDSDKNLRRVEEPEPAPVVKKEVKSEDLPKADESAKEVKHGDPSQSKGVLRSDKDMTQAEAKTILNQTPEDKAKQAAKDKKAIASNKADSRAFQRNLDAAKVANLKSNAEFNKKQQAKKAAEAHAAKMKKLKDNPELQAAEPVYPEQLLTPGGGAKTVAGMAKNLANRNVVSKAPEYSTPLLSAPPKQLTGPSKADIVARDRAAREAARQKEMLRENADRYGLNPNAPGYEGAAGSLRKNLGGDNFSLGMKRGGAVKMASGGMTASRRGDGIASRGKTRCKMY
jgi:hypothetical protein